MKSSALTRLRLNSIAIVLTIISLLISYFVLWGMDKQIQDLNESIDAIEQRLERLESNDEFKGWI